MVNPAESSIAIIGAARDVGEFLEELIKTFQKSFAGFKKIHYFIVENNSKDNTKEVLQALEKNFDNFHPFFLDDNLHKIHYKTERISEARNYALNQIKNFFPEINYIAVADLDAVNLGLTRKSIESCWHHSNWSAMFANQPDGYYDIYALRHAIWCPRNFLEDYEILKKQFGKKIAIELSLKSKRLKIKADSSLVRVDSAFGGLGIYKAGDILSEKYIGLDDMNNPICEHLSVNLGILQKGGTLYINPGMTNARSYNLITKPKAMIYEKIVRKYNFMGID